MDTTELTRAMREATDGVNPSASFVTNVLRGGARRRVRRRLTVATSAFTVTALAGTSAYVLWPGTTAPETAPAGNNGSTLAPPTSDISEQVRPTFKRASMPDQPTPEQHAAAVELLNDLAEKAEQSMEPPLVVPKGKLLYARTEGVLDQPRRSQLGEEWLDVEGSIAVMIRNTEFGEISVSPDPTDPTDGHEAEVRRWREQLRKNGASLLLPTSAFRQGMPTDPNEMLAFLEEQTRPSRGAWSIDRGIIEGLNQFLSRNEPLLDTKVRAALFRALAKVDSIYSTGEPVTIGGREVYVISQSERDTRHELLVDVDTGRVVGSRSQWPGEPPYHSFWSHKVVDEAGDTR